MCISPGISLDDSWYDPKRLPRMILKGTWLMNQVQLCEGRGPTVHTVRVCNSIQSGHFENPYVSRLPVHHSVKSWSRGIHHQLPTPWSMCHTCDPTYVPVLGSWLLWQHSLPCLKAHTSCLLGPALPLPPHSLAARPQCLPVPNASSALPRLCCLGARQPARRRPW